MNMIAPSVSSTITHVEQPKETVINIPPNTPHKENHAENSAYLESAVLGMADGLTVPFALTAGLSS
jgi:hypothetical protein